MNNNVKTKNDKEIAYFFNAGDRMIKGIDALRKRTDLCLTVIAT